MAIKVLDGVQFWLWKIFKEDLPWNIPAKFGPNWPNSLGREDVKRNY